MVRIVSAALAPPMRRAGRLIAVAFIRSTTATSTTTTAGHSGLVVAAPSAVMGPLDALRRRRLCVGTGKVGLKIILVVLPRFHRVVHAGSEIVLIGRSFLGGLLFHNVRRSARCPATSPRRGSGTLFGHSQIQRERSANGTG
jgi:hypothetical protein